MTSRAKTSDVKDENASEGKRSGATMSGASEGVTSGGSEGEGEGREVALRDRVRRHIAELLQEDIDGVGELLKEIWEACGGDVDREVVCDELARISGWLRGAEMGAVSGSGVVSTVSRDEVEQALMMLRLAGTRALPDAMTAAIRPAADLRCLFDGDAKEDMLAAASEASVGMKVYAMGLRHSAHADGRDHDPARVSTIDRRVAVGYGRGFFDAIDVVMAPLVGHSPGTPEHVMWEYLVELNETAKAAVELGDASMGDSIEWRVVHDRAVARAAEALDMPSTGSSVDRDLELRRLIRAQVAEYLQQDVDGGELCKETWEQCQGGVEREVVRDELRRIVAWLGDRLADRTSTDLELLDRALRSAHKAADGFRRMMLRRSREVDVLESAVRWTLESSTEGLAPVLRLRSAYEEICMAPSGKEGAPVVVPGWESEEDLRELEAVARSTISSSSSLEESARRRTEYERVMTPQFVLRVLAMARFAVATGTADVAELAGCARAHGDAARVYERSGNARGAAELRRVENLLWALARGERWSVVLDVAPPAVGSDRAVDMTLSGEAVSRLRAYVESRMPADAGRLPDLQLRACAISCGLRHVSEGIVIDQDARMVLESLASRDFLDGAVEELLAVIEARFSRAGRG